jgi:hypothetical protein
VTWTTLTPTRFHTHLPMDPHWLRQTLYLTVVVLLDVVPLHLPLSQYSIQRFRARKVVLRRSHAMRLWIRNVHNQG